MHLEGGKKKKKRKSKSDEGSSGSGSEDSNCLKLPALRIEISRFPSS
jgi:hypothetical protein